MIEEATVALANALRHDRSSEGDGLWPSWSKNAFRSVSAIVFCVVSSTKSLVVPQYSSAIRAPIRVCG